MIEALTTLFSEILHQPMPHLTENTLFSELPGWDSVAHLSLLLAVERHFGTTFTSSQMVTMQTIGDMLDALGQRDD